MCDKVNTCFKAPDKGQLWWCTSVITAFRTLRQEHFEFKATLVSLCSFNTSLVYGVRPYLKK